MQYSVIVAYSHIEIGKETLHFIAQGLWHWFLFVQGVVETVDMGKNKKQKSPHISLNQIIFLFRQ